jgi:hypothetical protein
MQVYKTLHIFLMMVQHRKKIRIINELINNILIV